MHDFFGVACAQEHDNAWSCCLQQKAPSLKGVKWYIALNRWVIPFGLQCQWQIMITLVKTPKKMPTKNMF